MSQTLGPFVARGDSLRRAVQSAAIPSQRKSETLTLGRVRKSFFGLFVFAMLATHAFFLWSVRDRIAHGDPDFTAYYTAGKILRKGSGPELFRGSTQLAIQQEFAASGEHRRGPLSYIHPPFEALLFLPLTFLPYPIAFLVWSLLNLGFLSLALWLLRHSLDSLRGVGTSLLTLISLAFFPIFANFHQGQDAILLLLLVLLAFLALDRGADFVAGCWFGLGLFKFQLIIPLVFVLALWGKTRLLRGFLVTAAVLALVSVAIVGWEGALRYPLYAWSVVSNPGFGGAPLRQLPSLQGLLGGWPLWNRAGWRGQLSLWLCSAVPLIILAALTKDFQQPELRRLSFAYALVTALLVAYSTSTYDLSLLLVPLALVWDHCVRQLRGNLAATRALLIPAIPLLFSPLWFFLWLQWARTNLMAVFLLWWLFAIRGEIKRLRGGTEPIASQT